MKKSIISETLADLNKEYNFVSVYHRMLELHQARIMGWQELGRNYEQMSEPNKRSAETDEQKFKAWVKKLVDLPVESTDQHMSRIMEYHRHLFKVEQDYVSLFAKLEIPFNSCLTRDKIADVDLAIFKWLEAQKDNEGAFRYPTYILFHFLTTRMIGCYHGLLSKALCDKMKHYHSLDERSDYPSVLVTGGIAGLSLLSLDKMEYYDDFYLATLPSEHRDKMVEYVEKLSEYITAYN